MTVSPNILHIKLKIKIDTLPERRCDGINHAGGHPATHPVNKEVFFSRPQRDQRQNSWFTCTKVCVVYRWSYEPLDTDYIDYEQLDMLWHFYTAAWSMTFQRNSAADRLSVENVVVCLQKCSLMECACTHKRITTLLYWTHSWYQYRFDLFGHGWGSTEGVSSALHCGTLELGPLGVEDGAHFLSMAHTDPMNAHQDRGLGSLESRSKLSTLCHVTRDPPEWHLWSAGTGSVSGTCQTSTWTPRVCVVF